MTTETNMKFGREERRVLNNMELLISFYIAFWSLVILAELSESAVRADIYHVLAIIAAVCILAKEFNLLK